MLDDEGIAKLMKKIEESSAKSIEAANAKQTDIIKQYIQKEVNIVKDSFEIQLESKCNEFERKYNELKNKYERLEKSQRKNNIILFGIPPIQENLLGNTLQLLNQHLELSVTANEINNIYTVGKRSDRKPIIISFLSYLRKQEVIKCGKKFKGTGISVAEDISIEERHNQKILRLHLKEARSKKQEAFIKNKKLIVNGVAHTVEELQSLETITEFTNQDDEGELTENTEGRTVISVGDTLQKSEDQNEGQLGKYENRKGSGKESRITRRGNTKEVYQTKDSEVPKRQKSPVSKNLRSK